MEVKIEETDWDEGVPGISFLKDAFSREEISPPKDDKNRKKEEVRMKLESGEYSVVYRCPTFDEILNENGQKIDLVQCKNCFGFLSARTGGHMKNHKNQRCKPLNGPPEKKPKLDPQVVGNLQNHILDFVTESGVSLNIAESEKFRIFIISMIITGNPNVNVDEHQFLSGEWIRKTMKEKSCQYLDNIGAELKDPVSKGDACLILDYGRQLDDTFSIFVSYTNRSSGYFSLRVIPLAFTPLFEKKITEKTLDYILHATDRVGLPKEHVLKLKVVAEGATNMLKLGEYFDNYSPYAYHSLQKCAERVFDPLKPWKSSITSSEKSHAKVIEKGIEICGMISSKLRLYKLTEQLSRTPAQSRANEWLASYHCARDILHVFPQIADLKDDRIEPLVDELRQCKGVLEDCFEIFSLFENPLKLLEQPEQQIQNVAGVMFELYAQLDRIYIKAVDPKQPKECLAAVAKMAKLSIAHYTKITVTDVHLICAFLSPDSKNLKNFPAPKKNKAYRIVNTLMKDVVVPPPSLSQPILSPLLMAIKNDPSPIPTVSQEFNDYVQLVVSSKDATLAPLEFWAKYQERFPRMSEIAAKNFCVMSSPGVCGPSFIVLRSLFRVDRHSKFPDTTELMMISYLMANELK